MATEVSKQRDEVSVLSRRCQSIIRFHEQLGGLVAKSVQLVWAIGAELTQVKGTLDHGQFLPWVEQNLPFSERTARNYMKVFDRYPEGLPPGLDLSTAYIEAGVRKLAAAEGEVDVTPKKALVIPVRDWSKDFDRLFKSTTKTGVELHNYRVAVNAQNRVVYALRNGHKEPIPLLAGLMVPKAGSEEAWAEFHEFLQVASEHFLVRIEALEDEGVIQPPEDRSVLGKFDKARKTSVKGAGHVHQ